MYQVVPLTEPEFAAVTVAEAKLHLRIDGTNAAEDTYIESLIVAATELCESYCDLQICQREFSLKLTGFPPGREPIYFPRGNFTNLTAAVNYTDTAGTTQTISTADLTQFGAQSNYGGVVPDIGTVWPATTSDIPYVVSCDYQCGWATANDVPKLVKQAILVTVGHLYENRESQTMPRGAMDLLMPFVNGDEFSRYGEQ